MVYDQLQVFEAKEKKFPLSTFYVYLFMYEFIVLLTVSPPLVKILYMTSEK